MNHISHFLEPFERTQLFESQLKKFNCCCCAYLSTGHRIYTIYPQTFHCNDCFVFGGIHICLGVSKIKCYCGFLVLWIRFLYEDTNQRQKSLQSVFFKDAITRPGWELNPNNAIKVVVKTTLLPSRPRWGLFLWAALPPLSFLYLQVNFKTRLKLCTVELDFVSVLSLVHCLVHYF